jgi:hypothetical protein
MGKLANMGKKSERGRGKGVESRQAENADYSRLDNRHAKWSKKERQTDAAPLDDHCKPSYDE